MIQLIKEEEKVKPQVKRWHVVSLGAMIFNVQYADLLRRFSKNNSYELMMSLINKGRDWVIGNHSEK